MAICSLNDFMAILGEGFVIYPSYTFVFTILSINYSGLGLGYFSVFIFNLKFYFLVGALIG